METQKIKVDQIKLSDIITEFSRGQVRIPRFQRDYVWDKPRVVKLLNSIHREYPIGTFFFWEASPEYTHLYRNIPELNIPEPDQQSNFKFILDGQQRITSLYVATKGLVLNIQDRNLKSRKIDYSEISFDLDKEEFCVKIPDNERFVSLSSILVEHHMSLFRSLTDERAKSFERCYQKFSTYPLSVVYVRNQDIAQACEIFERINQGGVKLSLFDLVVASTWSNEFDLKEEVNKLNEELQQKGFGAVPPENVLQTLSLYIKGPATKVAQLQIKKDEIINSWPIITEATKLAIDYLRVNLGVKIIEFIPYPAIISMLTYLFAKKKNKSLTAGEQKFVQEWFWKSAFSQRYASSTQTLMGEDRRDLFDIILSDKTPIINYPITLNEENIIETKMYRYSSIRNGILCLMVQKDPLHFINNSKISLDRTTLSDFNSPERHHIFPRAYLKKTTKTYDENSIANFAFIPGELNRLILDAPPKKYFKKYIASNNDFGEMLKSHLISAKTYQSIEEDNFEQFLLERSKTILSEIEKKTGKISRIEEQIKNNPNSVIDVLEDRLRIIINLNLEEKFGADYWKKAIPGDIQEGVSKKIKENTKRYPDHDIMDDLEKLTFCNFTDYNNIILKYWNLFEDEFISRGDYERNFLYLNDYRNATKHSRVLSSIEQKQGEAAAEWFSNILDPFFNEKTDRQIDITTELDAKEKYYIKTADKIVNAIGARLESGEVVVFKGSIVKLGEAPSFEEHCRNIFEIRKQLISNKVLITEDGSRLKLTRDYVFSSPSAASCFVLGRSSNGWTEWKDKQGNTLDQNKGSKL